MIFDVIAFDADDTLWHSESFYNETQVAFADVLTPYGVDHPTALDVLRRIEIANLASFGFGIKGFTLSMIDAAVEATGGRISAIDIRAIIELGKAMTKHDLYLLDHAAGTVTRLSKTYPLMMITKGDLIDQERKIIASGLASYFRQAEIVSDKNLDTYTAVLRKYGLAPERFLMVGNSMRSDILPVLEIGGWAVYVPYVVNWSYESGITPEGNNQFYAIDHLGLLPELVAKIESST